MRTVVQNTVCIVYERTVLSSRWSRMLSTYISSITGRAICENGGPECCLESLWKNCSVSTVVQDAVCRVYERTVLSARWFIMLSVGSMKELFCQHGGPECCLESLWKNCSVSTVVQNAVWRVYERTVLSARWSRMLSVESMKELFCQHGGS